MFFRVVSRRMQMNYAGWQQVRIKLFFYTMVISVLWLGRPAIAEPYISKAITTPQSTAQLVIDRKALSAGDSAWLALHLELKDGWHSYANPAGDSGYPTALILTLPEGVGASDIYWLPAKRFMTDDIVNYGYSGEAWHFVELQVADALSGHVEIGVKAEWLVCKSICIPERGEWQVRLPITAIPATTDATFTAMRLRATLGEAKIVEESKPAITEEKSSPASTGTGGFWVALFSAFIGGVILNLMPCVLPILSLKIISLVKIAHHSRTQAAQHGICYTCGILCGFSGFAALLYVLQAGSASLGWGFQLHSPAVVVGLSLLMLVIGLNLSGVFDVPNLFANVGSHKAQGNGRAGSFFTGLLAVMVATPCTAPFMAGALGFALLQPLWIQWLIFMSLGLGLAFPFLVISLMPSLQRFLPKSGAWMLRFKQGLAFPMYGAAAWLAWVATQQHGASLLALVFVCAVMVAWGLWLVGQCNVNRYSKRIVMICMVGLVGLSLWWAEGDRRPSSFVALAEPYSAARLSELRTEGKPVFIYATADWCVTCKLNERLVLRRTEVVQHLQQGNISVLKADWTKSDPAITALLTQHSLAGVPAYIYYAKGSVQPTILPSLLTVQKVKDALQ